jgi:5'(3')-deoxyribonucleotidase
MSIKIYFDLDGTIFDLYNKNNWLEYIKSETSGLFATGDFLEEIDKLKFDETINKLLNIGVEFAVITWLPMQASNEYETICSQEKINWVKENLPFVNEISCLSYGIPKQNAIKKRCQKMYLIDDNSDVCNTWATNSQRIAINVDSDFTVVNALETILKENS